MERPGPARRIADLNALVAEHMGGPAEAKMARMVCNSCGTTLTLTTPPDAPIPRLLEMALAGWDRDPAKDTDNDRCPVCAGTI